MCMKSEKKNHLHCPWKCSISLFPQTMCMIHELFISWAYFSGLKCCYGPLKVKGLGEEETVCQAVWIVSSQKKQKLVFLPVKNNFPIFVLIAWEVSSCPLYIYMQYASTMSWGNFCERKEPWPPHYSLPWSSLKSDIVSLRFLSQSSAGLSIVGGTDNELRLIYGGRRQVAHIISRPAAVNAAAVANKSWTHPSRHG